MGKVRPGNKQNSGLNGEWVTHARRDLKKATARLRRILDLKKVQEGIEEDKSKYDEYDFDDENSFVHPEDDMN